MQAVSSLSGLLVKNEGDCFHWNILILRLPANWQIGGRVLSANLGISDRVINTDVRLCFQIRAQAGDDIVHEKR